MASQNLNERVKAVATEEAQKVRAVTTDAVKSRAYIYPVKVSLSSKMLVLKLTTQGHILFRLPQRPLEASDLKIDPNHHDGHWCDDIMFRSPLPPPSSYHGIHIWSRGRSISSLAHVE